MVDSGRYDINVVVVEVGVCKTMIFDQKKCLLGRKKKFEKLKKKFFDMNSTKNIMSSMSKSRAGAVMHR
jgi:hypothetical protein